MYQLTFYVPKSHLEIVKLALFGAGAGHIGDYDHCAWQTKGSGQFRPLKGSTPFVGEIAKSEVIEEYKVEMVCETQGIKQAIKALLDSHPYETPAYSVVEIKTLSDF